MIDEKKLIEIVNTDEWKCKMIRTNKSMQEVLTKTIESMPKYDEWTPGNIQEPPEQGEQIKSILVTMEDDNGYRWVTNTLNDFAMKNSKIVAWMPLPKPWEGEK